MATTIVLASATMAGAQDAPPPPGTQPIGRFAVDVRVAFPKFKQDLTTASRLGVTAENLPARAFGLVFGAHVYPTRIGRMTLGLGGELLVSGRSRTVKPTTEGGDEGPTVNTRFSALSPQVSFNFGKRDGWSYVSGGIGWSTFTVEREDDPLPAPESRTKTINYGGGARWFATRHLAFAVDVRFYAVNPQVATATRPAFPRMTLLVLNAGVGFK
jgi:hypothetical protein